MVNAYKRLRESVYHSPLVLPMFPSKLQGIAADYLPYSTGFEIECSYARTTLREEYKTQDIFRAIPNIMEVNMDCNEQRFRIPAGMKGLICLYDICSTLKDHSLLNTESGIHYHVDFTDCWELITNTVIRANNDWIIKELEKWNYTGRYNEKICSTSKTWVKFHSGYRTMEIRIGEMSFDYEVLAKRIIHANQIARRLKNILRSPKRTKVPKASGSYITVDGRRLARATSDDWV